MPVDRFRVKNGRERVRRDREPAERDAVAAHVQVATFYREQQLDKARSIAESATARPEAVAWAWVVVEWLSQDAPKRCLVGGLARSVSILAEQCRLATEPRSVPRAEKLCFVNGPQLRRYLFDTDGRRQARKDASRAPWMSDRSLLPKAPPGRGETRVSQEEEES